MREITPKLQQASRTHRFLLIGFLVAAIGCGKNDIGLVAVQGRVTLDGKPLSRASVMFAPADSNTGGPAFALTDDSGNYELQYTHAQKGALCGKCVVRIKTGFQSIEDEDKGIRRRETVPAKYNRHSTLTVD